ELARFVFEKPIMVGRSIAFSCRHGDPAVRDDLFVAGIKEQLSGLLQIISKCQRSCGDRRAFFFSENWPFSPLSDDAAKRSRNAGGRVVSKEMGVSAQSVDADRTRYARLLSPGLV